MPGVTRESAADLRSPMLPAVDRLARLIEELEAPSDTETTDARRRYYGLTPRGKEAAAAEAERLAGLVEHAAFSGLIKTPKAAH